MFIQKQVTVGEQFGSIEVIDDTTVTINLTNLKGRITLGELEAVLKESRDLERRLNPPAPVKKRTSKKR